MAAMTDAASTAGPDASLDQLLRLASGGERLAVPIGSVREILEVGRLTPVPRTPDFIRGVMNLRGAVVPVLDLSARLGLRVTPLERRSAIVVVESQPGGPQRLVVGLLVDAVFEVLDVAAQRVEAVPSLGVAVPGGFLHGMVNVKGGYVAVLNLVQILELDTLARLIGDAARGPAWTSR